MSYTISIHLYCSLPEHCSVSIITSVNLITDLRFTRCKSFKIYNHFQPIILRKRPYVPQRESISALLFVGQKITCLMQLAKQSLMRRLKPINTHEDLANLFTIVHSSLCKGRMHSWFCEKTCLLRFNILWVCLCKALKSMSSLVWPTACHIISWKYTEALSSAAGRLSQCLSEKQSHRFALTFLRTERGMLFSVVLLMGNHTSYKIQSA